MSWLVHLTKINDSAYVAEVIDKSQPEQAVVFAALALVLLIGLTAYVVRRDYNLKKERLETTKRLVSVLEKLEKKLER
ncbi:hypothetical protein DRP04_15825, partial [Archaeoglobales archaeon]